MALCGACTVHLDGANAILHYDASNPRPADSDISGAMSGNVSRCGTCVLRTWKCRADEVIELKCGC